ncbi:MAG: DUF2304 domain-containing protein [Lachnospiraceae bacterium]|nr:DUF2304 domain-containing protein [Lachnospiraceae bacterium]
MSVGLRVLLIVVSVLNMFQIMRKIRQSKFQIEYSIFWIILSVCLILMAVFPGIMLWLADMTGVISPVNMIFLIVIFVLLMKLFYLNIHVSQLEYKVKELIQKIALNDFDKEQDEKNGKNERNR